MNKGDLIKVVKDSTGLSGGAAKAAVEAVLEAVICELQNDESVSLVGFGTFSVAYRAARSGFNPLTKAKIEIPARRVVRFKPSKTILA